MKKGICLPKLALALAGEAGVPKDVLETSVRWTDGSVLILSPINLLTSEAARRWSSMVQLGISTTDRHQAAAPYYRIANTL